MLCGVEVPGLYVRVDRVDERGDVGDRGDPFVRVETRRFPGEAELEGPVRKRLEAQVAFGVNGTPNATCGWRRRSRSGSHCTRAGARFNWRFHAASSAWSPRS